MIKIELTRYYLVAEEDYSQDNKIIPVKNKNGQVIAMVNPSFFAAASLEGSAKLSNGQVINVDGGYTAADLNTSAALSVIAQKQFRGRNGYAGLSGDGTKYFTYSVSPSIWGVGIHNYSLMPFVSVASDQKFYPFGTLISIPMLKGMVMADGTTHAGVVQCCDTGSAIVGEAHLDFFVGFKRWEMMKEIPEYVDAEVYTPTK